MAQTNQEDAWIVRPITPVEGTDTGTVSIASRSSVSSLGFANPQDVESLTSLSADSVAADAGAKPKDPRLGQTLAGRYRIERLIGKGGMGRVYMATQLTLNRSVAVKILNRDFQDKDPQFVRRFFLEAATAAQLNHTNTITIYDYGETDTGELFIAMEYLRGSPLSRALAFEGPAGAERTLHIAMQVARALREAHGKGIIHRDLKPGNIMLIDDVDDPDQVKVLDFGLVKLFAPEHSDLNTLVDVAPAGFDGETTRAGMFLGSPNYMAPEQIQGAEVDPRIDVYALGVVMFHMLAGRVPFRGKSSIEILYKHVNNPVPTINEVAGDVYVPAELEGLVRRCLAKDREERVASMSDLLFELKHLRRAILGTGSLSGSISEVDPVAFQVMAEKAGFTVQPATPEPNPTNPAVDDGDEELIAVIADEPQRRSWLSLALAGTAAILVAVLGFLAYPLLTTLPQGEPPPSVPAAPVAAPTRHVQIGFASQPTGARVFEGKTLLGRTPLTHHAKVSGDQLVLQRTFLFRKAGYGDASITQKLVGDRVEVSATLTPEPAEASPPPPVKSVVSREVTRHKPTRRRLRKNRARLRKAVDEPTTPSEYKDNPY